MPEKYLFVLKSEPLTLSSLTDSRNNSLLVDLTRIHSMSEHKVIVARLCAEKYEDARVIYWAGSVTI